MDKQDNMKTIGQSTRRKGHDVIRLSGTPEEMGAQHGEALREEVNLITEEFMPRVLHALRLSREAAIELLAPMEEHIGKSYVSELAALAESAGVAYEDLLAYNCIPDISNYFEREMCSCTNFVVYGQATADGNLLHGRNLDFFHMNLMPKAACILLRRPTNGTYATLAVMWAGAVGILTGTNAKGLNVGEVSALARDSSLAGTPGLFLIRHALETCSTVEDFAATFEAPPRTTGFNIAVSNGRDNSCRAIEFTTSLCEARGPSDDVLVVDDPCLCSSTGKNRLLYAWGTFRHARLMQLIGQNYGKITPDIAQQFLRDKGDAAYLGAPGANNRCICNPNTVQSVLFDPSRGKMFVAHGTLPAPDAPYLELDVPALLD